jgi:hypothetical protein
MREMLAAVVAAITGALGACWSKSADPDRDVDELLPCFAITSNADAMIEDVVEMLKVL